LQSYSEEAQGLNPIMSLKTIFTDRLDVSKERLEICGTCEFYVPITTQCNQCGCFMRGKTLLLDAECPIGKWSKKSDEPQ
jgi:hypothetical protein